MAADSAGEAVDAFFATHQTTVSSVTPAVLLGRAYRVAQRPHFMTFPGNEGVRLGRRSALSLAVSLWYDLMVDKPSRLWSVAVAGYEYRLRHRDGREILTYHWHPIGPSRVTTPHLHVGGRTVPVDLTKAHLPTGQVSLAAVVRLTIADLGVEPLRADWSTVLDRAEQDLAG